MSYELFIGQNNETKKLEADKMVYITLRHYEGATFGAQGKGIYDGEVEKNITVIVNSSSRKLKEYMKDLKKELNQKEIAYRKANNIKFY